jgi:hypothetical protein
METGTRFSELRGGPATTVQLEELWAAAEPVKVEEMLGSWHGGDFANGHPASALLDKIRWHGKRFDAPIEAHPLICRGEDDRLYSNTAAAGGGLASLWPIEVDGSVTATMVYDAMPVLDHFRRVDERAVLGKMTGKLEAYFGTAEPYWFWLEREG